MRAHSERTMQAVKEAQALPDLFGTPETRHKALQTSSFLALPDIVFPTLAPSPLVPVAYPDRSVSFSPQLAGTGINTDLAHTSLYGGRGADPSLPTLGSQRVLGVRSGTDSLCGVGLSRAGHSSQTGPPYPLPQFPPLSGTHLPGAAAAHPNVGAGRNLMSQRHSVPAPRAAVSAAPRAKRCHHLLPCCSCQSNSKCCVCLDRLGPGLIRIQGGAPSPASPSEESNDSYDDADDDDDSSTDDTGDHTFRAPIPSLRDTPGEEAAANAAMEALEEEEFWQCRPDTVQASLNVSPVPSLTSNPSERGSGRVPTSQPNAEVPLTLPGAFSGQVPTSQPSVEASLQQPPRTPATSRAAVLPYPPRSEPPSPPHLESPGFPSMK